MEKIFFVLLLVFSINAYSDAEKHDFFISHIINITKEVDPINEGFFAGSEKFRYLVCNINKYEKEILEGLSGTELSEDEKYTISLLVHSFELKAFISFLKQADLLFDEEKISPFIFTRIIGPTHDWSTLIRDSYQDEELRKILIKATESNRLEKDLKSYLKYILSGRHKNSFLSMFDSPLPENSIVESLKNRCKSFDIDN